MEDDRLSTSSASRQRVLGSRAGTPSNPNLQMFTRSQCNGRQCSIPGCDHKKRRVRRTGAQTEDTSTADGFSQASESYDFSNSYSEGHSHMHSHLHSEQTSRSYAISERISTPLQSTSETITSNGSTRRRRAQTRSANSNGQSVQPNESDDEAETIYIIRRVKKFFMTTINNTTSRLRGESDSPMGSLFTFKRLLLFLLALLLPLIFLLTFFPWLAPSISGAMSSFWIGISSAISSFFSCIFSCFKPHCPEPGPAGEPSAASLAMVENLVHELRLMRRELEDLKARTPNDKQIEEVLRQHQITTASNVQPAASVSVDEIKALIQDALALYDADKTGIPDYALEPSGGTVINTRCSETFDPHGIQYRIFGIPIWTTSISPRAVIQPGINPGECWAFKGATGMLVIRLSQRIRPTGFTYEHIPKQISRDGSIQSAPKNFIVKGLKDEEDKVGVVLGEYTYQDNDRPLQYFEVADKNPGLFNFIELVVLTNHGNPEYTCLYRFRVHGKRVLN